MLKLLARVVVCVSAYAIILCWVVEFHLIVWSWLFQGVGGSICLIGQFVFSKMRLSNNRSVMPLDVLGGTRATMKP